MVQPKLRFMREDGTEFPEWEKEQFGSTVLIERGGSPRPIKQFITNGEGYNWVKIGDAPKYGKYITQTTEKIKKSGLDKTRQVFKGDLILSNSMSFGKPYIMAIDGCIHDGWLLVRNNQNIYDLIYLCYLLGTDYMLKQYKSLAGGSTVNNLNKDLVSMTTVFIPCLEEQQKIANFLSTVDEVIAQSEAEVQNLEQQKKAAMQKIFSQEVRFRREDGASYPDWRKDKWSNLGQFVSSGTLSKADLSEEGTPCILYGELYTKYGEIAHTIYSKTNSNSHTFSKKDDVILPKSGETPEDISTATCIPYDDVSLGGDLIVFRHNEKVIGTFLSYLISNRAKNAIASIAQGKSVVHISEKGLANIELSFPCLEEQQKIADFLSAYDEAITYAKQELDKWKELKKGLLQQMFV